MAVSSLLRVLLLRANKASISQAYTVESRQCTSAHGFLHVVVGP